MRLEPARALSIHVVDPATTAVGYRDVAPRAALVIRRAWRAASPWHAAPASVPWLGIGIALGALASRAAGHEPRSSALLVAVLGAWLVLTLVLAWEALARLVNHTRIVLDARGLRVTHGPVPLPGARSVAIDRAALAGFAVERDRRAGAGALPCVVARTRDARGREHLLELDDPAHARLVAEALSRHLGPTGA